MSLWKRLQRIGMKAAKFQFTVSLEKLHIKFDKDYQPKAVIIVFTRRGRRCSSQPVTLQKSPTDKSTLINEWALPENLEVLTTLYRNEKDISFEDKEWTFQVEDVCMSSSEFKEASISATTRRRVLATRSLNLAEFASTLPTQNNLKINLRAASKKVSTATLFFTLHGLMLRCGEATDEDMISVASSMSLTYAPPSAYGARWGSESPTPPFAPVEQAGGNPNLRNDFANISSQLQALERCPDLREVDEEEEDAEADTNGAKSPQIEMRGMKSSSGDTSQPEPASQLVDGGGQAKVTSQTGQDLLTWCQEVTASYPGVKVKDLTLCFRSGLALCAIIHHFQPEAIGDFERVKVLSPTERVRLAFDVASRFGVARVFLDPCEVVRGKGGGPDRLTMMTYLHQLRTRLTAMADRPVAEEDDKATDEPTVERHEDDSKPADNTDSAKMSSSKKKEKKKRRVSGGGNASERYEHLLTKARNLLLESKTTAQPGSIDLMASHFPENSTENQPSADPTHGNANEQSDQLAETPQAGNLKVRKLKLSNLKLFADGMEPHLTPNHSSPQKSPQPSRPSYSKSTQLPPFPCACTNAVVSCLAPGSPKDEETNPFQQTRLSPFSLVGSQKQNPRTGEQRKLRVHFAN
uniref:Calponin-homology (CH) domain-containing protein n=1 Tax=Mesocestoides corti TaxID=53468 RepID=A0A5K3ETH6_MESCO